MFRNLKSLPCLILSMLISTFCFGQETQKSELDGEAKKLIAFFAKSLKAELSSAIKQGGLEKGVEVCSQRAGSIASELSVEGWQLTRVSLKNRQPNNAPDEWETSVLNSFEQQKQQGSSPAVLYHSEVSGNTFRAMKAIPTQSLCLACHGKQIAPAVQDVIGKHYPEDKATGYELGDIRGAFSLTKTLADMSE